MKKLKIMLIFGFVLIFLGLLIYNFREPIGEWIEDNFGEIELIPEPDFELPEIGVFSEEV